MYLKMLRKMERFFLEQMLHKCSFGANAPFANFRNIFKNIVYSKLKFLEIFQCCLKIENDVMI